MLELIPIITPTIDWRQYLSIANDVLGESISTSFDAARLMPGPKAFIVSLNDLKQNIPALDIDVAALRHLTYTFLTVTLEGAYRAIAEEVQLAFTSSSSQRPGICLVVVSGNLLQWKDAVHVCSGSSNPDVRLFAHKARVYFEGLGLGDMWKHYIRVKLPDQTLKLVHRE